MAESRRVERGAVAFVGAVLLLAFVGMPAWWGLKRASFEAYEIKASDFEAKLDGMVTRYRVGEEDGVPVVRPPAGDVYVVAERWRFRPMLELTVGETYRIHVASLDILHGVVIGGREALVAPGKAAVLTLTAGAPGRMTMVCSEYCGLEHNKMRTWITVAAKP